MHLKPRIGRVRLDRLNVGHLVEMFDAIADENEVIAAENEARREQIARCKPSKPGRPVGAERKLLAAERAKLAEMEPFRKITSPATRQAIRRTLRAALNSAIAQQLITFNPASHVELESGRRPKPLLWTEERVRRWREMDEVPGPVMVWTPQQFGTFLDAAEGDRLYAMLDREIAEKAAMLIPRSRPAATEPSAPAAADPQATGTSAHASRTQGPENETAPEPTEADPDAA